MIEFFDAVLRGVAVGALLIFGFRLGLARPLSTRTAMGAALAICQIVYVLVSSHTLHNAEAAWLDLLKRAPVINPFLLWWVSIAIFDDRFTLRPWHAAPLVAVVIFSDLGVLSPLRSAVIAALYLHIIYVAVTTARGDLVAQRIVFRRLFIALFGVTGLVILGFEVALGGVAPPEILLVQAAAIAALSLGFAYWTHGLKPDLWPETAPPPQTTQQMEPKEQALITRLEAAMQSGVWREEGLTIGALAQKLDAPEHRLRKLINQRLGHRNFPAFINAARVDAAAEALSDPAQAEKQIITIAYESGFASLGPFNRAFRAEKGVSPGEWRASAGRS